MSKPTIIYRRFITNSDGETKPYPSHVDPSGGTVSYELKINGTIEGLNNKQTEIVVQSLITSINFVMIPGLQTGEVVRKVRLLRKPYLSTLRALTDPDEETIDLLEF